MNSKPEYDLVVVGGGAGGLSVAKGAARLGAKVAVVEKEKLGGDCLYHGCVPSKTIIRTAKASYETREAGEFGVLTDNIRVNYSRLRERLRHIIDSLAEDDSSERLRALGIDVFFGSGEFRDSKTFAVDGQQVRGRKFAIATGSGPKIPDIDGIRDIQCQTNRTVFDLETLPRSMVIIGGGPVGVEMAQAFQRMGCQVTLIERKANCLGGEDPEIAQVLEKQLASDGVRILANHRAIRAEEDGNGQKRIHLEGPNDQETVAKGDEVLVGVGRTPNTQGLGLEAAGVATDAAGFIVANRRLRTSAGHIYALGDVIGGEMYTHVAEYEARIVIPNALYGLRFKADYQAAPHCTYTEPEVAHVGLTAGQAEAQGVDCEVYRHPMSETDRPRIDNRAYGMIKLVCCGKKLVGASIVGYRAGDLLHEYVLAMAHDLPITRISRTIHLYPSQGQATRHAADRYYERHLIKGRMTALLKWIFGLRGNRKGDD